VVEVLGRRAFVGRQREVARLATILDAVLAGGGRTLVLGGEAGVGKTRLLQRFEDEVADRARVVEGACLEAPDGSLPYGPFVEMLRDLVRATPAAELAAFLGPGRAELTRLLPELAPRAADVRTANGGDPTAQVRLFELILGLFERLASARPLVIVVEDAQWADPSTRELLGFLSRALRDAPALIVVTLRTDAQGGPVGNLSFIAELERDDQVERLDLLPFARDEVMEQLGSLMDEPPERGLVDRLYARSDGNPFFVEELVLAGATDERDVPPILRDILSARIGSLSPGARDVLRVAAAAGRRIDDELLGAAMGLSPRELATSLREAVDSGILVRSRVGDETVSSFRHGLLQEVVDAELFPAERAALHGAFAQALETRRAVGDQSVSVAEIARHWDGARQAGRALGPTVEAALAAERVYAWPEALRLWQRARELLERVPDGETVTGMPTPDLLARAAECALLAGDYGAAVELGRAALGLLDAGREPVRAGVLHNRLRWYLWEAGDRRGAAASVAEALRLIPAEPPSAERARAVAQQAGVLLFAGRHDESIAAARDALAMAREVDSPGEAALSLGILGWNLAALGDVDGGLAQFREGQAIAGGIDSVEAVALAATNLVALLDRVGRSTDELDAALEGYRLSDRLGIGRTYGALLLGYAARAEVALGRWDDAERSSSLGLHTAASDRAELWLSINRARLLSFRGQFAEAAVLLRRATTIADRRNGTEFRSALLAAEAELAVWSGDAPAARQAAAAGLALVAGGEPPDPALAWLAALAVRAEADAAARSRAAGQTPRPPDPQLLQVEGAIAEALANRPELAVGGRGASIVALLRAEQTRVAGTSDPRAWAAVVDAFDLLGRPFHAAYGRFRQAEAILATRGDRGEAAGLLRAARAVARDLAAAPLRDAIDALARQARLDGSGPDATGAVSATARAEPGAPYGFTARESEVLGLVAEGWTNQQIADALFITRKTASVHVSNILGKLAVGTRGEAAAMAHRLGLTDPGSTPRSLGGGG
jgi:DNA-binding CsgD family transcriptional regulator